MKDERPPLEPADDEELRCAAALARALEGDAAGPDLSEADLETAALLRLSAGVAALDERRRAEIRTELLAGLPARTETRRRLVGREAAGTLGQAVRGLPRWLYGARVPPPARILLLALPLAGTALVSWSLLTREAPSASLAERSARFEPASRVGSPSTALSRPAPSAAEQPTVSAPAPLAEWKSSSEVAPGIVADEAAARRADEGSTARRRAAESTLAESTAAESTLAEDTAAESRAARAAAKPIRAAKSQARGAAGALARRQAPMAAGSARGGAAERPAVGNLAMRPREPEARQAMTDVGRDARAERGALLARLKHERLVRAHAEADRARSRTEIERSRDVLARVLDSVGDELDPSDARLVRQDLYCRLAEAALRVGEPRTALEWTRRGLDLDGPPTPFLAQLMALEGDAWQALGEPSSAAASYMRALRVHESLLDESLDGR